MRRLLRQPRRDWLTVLEVSAFLAYSEVAFRLPRSLLLSRSVRRALIPSGRHARRDEAERVARILDAILRIWPTRVSCLQRSLTLVLALRQRGCGADLRIGARKSASGVEAHAWVEIDGDVFAAALRGAFPALEGVALSLTRDLRELVVQQ
ncbi:MAG TPA: lasso peptide biosynthesis B2 protein [Dehalococcoidia bacterium]|nr:lasso peptide biosynthesis B2 protein [Dehalococcoidia bacterium]